jgi:opacity protein-like surface antigen
VRTLALVIALAASVARAQEPAVAADGPTPHAWELDGFAGYGQLAWPALDTASTTWSNGNAAFALAVAYRGPHFTHPFVELSYLPIVASGAAVRVVGTSDLAPVTTSFASNSSWAWGLAVGPGFDLGRFRLRGGIGFYDVLVRTTVAGQTNTSSGVHLGFLAAAGAMVWQPDPFALGVEARLVALQAPTSGIYQSMWQVGLTGRWDFVHVR